MENPFVEKRMTEKGKKEIISNSDLGKLNGVR